MAAAHGEPRGCRYVEAPAWEEEDRSPSSCSSGSSSEAEGGGPWGGWRHARGEPLPPGRAGTGKRAARYFRSFLCWAAFAGFIWLEVAIHARRGVSQDELQAEADAPGWRDYLAFLEVICRACLVVAFAGRLWDKMEMDVAVCHEVLSLFAGLRCSDSLSCAQTLGSLLSLATVVIGTWSVFAGEGVPLWVATYAHVADVFCHAIVTSALVGGLLDLCGAALGCRLADFLISFARCEDTIEEHSVAGKMEESGAAFGDGICDGKDAVSRKDPTLEALQEIVQGGNAAMLMVPERCARAAFAWAVFVAFMLAYLFDQFRAVPAVLHKALSLTGVCCWAGICFWLMDRGARLYQRLRGLKLEVEADVAAPTSTIFSMLTSTM